jgi:predicted dehydrogenase
VDVRQAKLRGALIGFGYIMSEGHAAAYRRPGLNVDIEAIADVSEQRRGRAQELFPRARLYADHRSLLAAESAALDFVDIATPPSAHHTIALDALDAGCHVLCEKPLATSVDAACRMLDRARFRERVIFPCHNYRHAPVIKAVRKVIGAGTIGRVHMVTLQTFRNTHARGAAEWRPDWRRERRFSGGGIAMDHGSHTFYLAFEWLGTNPEAVTARAATLGRYDTEDDFSCSLRFPNGVATAHLSWVAGVRKVLYTIHGDRGAIRVEDDHLEVCRLKANALRSYRAEWDFRRRQIPSDWMDSSHATWFESMFGEFRTAIDAGDFVSAEAQQALLCIQVITTAYRSAAESSLELPLSVPETAGNGNGRPAGAYAAVAHAPELFA